MMIAFFISFSFSCRTLFISGSEDTPRKANRITPKGRKRKEVFVVVRFVKFNLLNEIIPKIKVTMKTARTPRGSIFLNCRIPFIVIRAIMSQNAIPAYNTYWVVPVNMKLRLCPSPIR